MLSVKHIDSDGRETVFPVKDLAFKPGSDVTVTRSDGTLQSFRSGVIYAMNENGRTVASYRLDKRAAG